MSWTISPSYKDPNYSNVSLLLHGNGANGSTTITDNSPTPKTVTAVGNAQISTAVADPFGNSARGVLAFDGDGDYLTSAANSAFDFGSSDFTIELWTRITSAANYGGLVSKGSSGAVDASTYSLEFNNTSNAISFYVGTGANTGSYIVSGTTNVRTSGSWHHVAVCRSGNNTRLFVNGTQEGSTSTVNYSIGSGQGLFIGGGFYAPLTNTINGYIDDLRITKGVARYTSNFTPPTAAFPDM